MLLSKDVKTARVVDSVAAGQTDVESSAVDARGYDTVAFHALLGTITAGGSGTLKAQHSDEPASGFVDVGADVGYTDADSDKVLVLEVSKPVKRYVRAVVVRNAENAQVDGVLALQARAAALPVEHDASVAGVTLALAPTS